ncbi:hypothetical protein M404DRAFT_828395 [Pisolithus tinctorius Marx 270]|uniref:Uncharacterized protein n=1 Tax=Pisolithus tinctorius Marx 270 TaxID=870435 RepID=A0A0C3JMQ1_PISTI|nr:hypothetical protein M404DRAFT_828395 [Pisolithus tinctorius Marx 270]
MPEKSSLHSCASVISAVAEVLITERHASGRGGSIIVNEASSIVYPVTLNVAWFCDISRTVIDRCLPILVFQLVLFQAHPSRREQLYMVSAGQRLPRTAVGPHHSYLVLLRPSAQEDPH